MSDWSLAHIAPQFGFLSHAHNIVMRNPVMIDVNFSDDSKRLAFESLRQNTIKGAQFDSSARHPPPQCHPGTRKHIIERIRRWFRDTHHQRILWRVGSAGVGKSAIVQTLAELEANSPGLTLGATLFFSRPNNRSDPTRVFITLAHQIALQCPPYREFVTRKMLTDPELLEKSMKTQFAKLIFEPFVQHNIFLGSGLLLIFLDGLDECSGDREQCEIVGLISYLSLAYPDAPLLWIIASRPEAHLKGVFYRKSIASSYEAVEVPVDSDQACADVECYLQSEFERIRKRDPIARLRSQWPTENELLMIAAASAGLFAFASTVIKFIDDPIFGNPVSGLVLLLATIKKLPQDPSNGRMHPLAHLDALYTCILSQIPKAILPQTNGLLIGHDVSELREAKLVFICNWAGITPQDAYGALRRLHSILFIPTPEDAEHNRLSFYHQSFYEYLKDPNRSHEFHISNADMNKLELDCCFRITKEAHTGMVIGGEQSKVSLSWLTNHRHLWQGDLQRWAARSFTGIIDRYDAGLVLAKLRDPAMPQIAQTFDLVWLWFRYNIDHNSHAKYIQYIQHRLDPRIRAELERLNLLRQVPIGTLDLDDPVFARGDERVYTICESDGSHPLGGWTSDDWVLPPHPGPDLWKGPTWVDYKSEYKYWWSKQHTILLLAFLHSLRFIQAHSPDTPVLFFGNINRSILIYEFKIPDRSQRWTYWAQLLFPKETLIGVRG